MDVRGYAVMAEKEKLVPWSFQRRDVGIDDVQIAIEWSGICHSDIHTGRSEWGDFNFPLVPGHEIVGRVTGVGANVSRFAVGQRVGVGVYVDSCRKCDNCLAGMSNYCREGMIGTFDALERDGKSITKGGYSNGIVVDQGYVVSVADSLDPAATAPLMCAGVTLYSPLTEWGAGPGKKVGIIGLGGLGHMGVKFAHALGAHVTVFSHSESKRADALGMGADDFIVTTDGTVFETHKKQFDLIINTVSAPIDLNDYLELLALDGTLVMVGLAPEPYPIKAFSMLAQRRRIAGSMIGPVGQLQEMLDFAAEHKIGSDIEIIKAEEINEAWDRVVDSDVRYRFVIDASSF
ncbi:MAG: NAD(P)-dependent alcohol dehydrogenase [Pontimonas sp.]|nr:NAD(P)-dependent alcohol dehydrogenase [Pontimonas sp.]